MDIKFYFDPLCPWCWMTANWVWMIQQDRTLNITWRPISLKLKNGDMAEPWNTRAQNSLMMLRVAEKMRLGGDSGSIAAYYKELGKSIHRDKILEESGPNIGEAIDDALAAIEVISKEYSDAAFDESLDKEVQASTDEAVALAGDDIGTPVISFKDSRGKDAALFGPVISELPQDKKEALELWDAYVVFATKPYFWELKRTRTVAADLDSTF